MLGRPLHHNPTGGGAEDAHLYFEQYARTLHSYERIFGESAPDDLWPDARRRLVEDPRARRIHPRDGFFVTWRQAWLLVGAAAFAAIAHFAFW